MIKSELILPIRFYDDLFNQYRFGNMSEPICEPLLVYPSRQLPHFQIKRTSSLLPPTQFKLRNICVDKDNNYYKVIPEGASNFHSPDAVTYFDGWPEGSYTYDNGVDPPESRVVVIAETNCNILKSVVLNPDYYTVASVTPPTVYYSGSSAIVSSSLQVYTKEKINPTQINAQRFAILRKKQDETTIILNYNKQEGATSKGILIPYDLRKDVVKNTGNILKPIKDTLLLDNS